MCYKDKENSQEGLIIELHLQAMFYALKIVQLVSVVIDKHITSLNAINAIVNKCKLCWENEKL